VVLSGVQERLAPLQSWLFPQRLYLELQDTAITAMVLQGRRLTWLDQLVLQPGLCQAGRPINPPALADLLGDWLIESGYAGAHISAVLPGSAAELRVLKSDQPIESGQFALPKQIEALRLPWPSETAVDVVHAPLPSLPGSYLSVAVESALLETWIELFADSGFTLDYLEAAPACALRSMGGQSGLLLGLDSDQSWLLRMEEGAPIWQWRLPSLTDLAALQEEFSQCLSFLKINASCAASVLAVASAALPASGLDHLQRGIGLGLDWIDPLAAGQLESSLSDLTGNSLGLLWGLVLEDVES